MCEIMKNVLFILFLLISTSCSTTRESYYQRENNKESLILNEFLYDFITNTQPHRKKSTIWLYDKLEPVTESMSKSLKKWADGKADGKWKEAIYDLSVRERESININFSQLTSIKDLKVLPGETKDKNYQNWNYKLSHPGFSNDSTIIMFTSTYECGPLCLSFDLFIYEKKDNKWKLIQVYNYLRS